MSGKRFVDLEQRSRASPEQFVAIVEFMECFNECLSHGDLTRPQQGMQGRIKADRLWNELGQLLNSFGGGVVKSVEKWKKVWADWKAKTKKKALLKQKEVSGTGGGPSTRSTITILEERVLGIMGLKAVVGDSTIEEGGFDDPILPPAQSLIVTESNNEHVVDFITEGNFEPSIPPPPFFQNTSPPQTQVPTPPLLASSPIRRPVPRRRRCPTSPSLVASPTVSTSRRRRLRKVQTPFERSTAYFVEIEKSRLQLEAEREKNVHEREMERLRLESRRLDLEEQQVQSSHKLERVLENLSEILTQLRPLPRL